MRLREREREEVENRRRHRRRSFIGRRETILLTCGNSLRQYSDWPPPTRLENQPRNASMLKLERERRGEGCVWERARFPPFLLFVQNEQFVHRFIFFGHFVSFFSLGSICSTKEKGRDTVANNNSLCSKHK